MIDELLERVGIRRDLPAAERAAAVVRAFPLRFKHVVGQRDATSAMESGWLAGTAECTRVMSLLFRGEIGRGTAFGGPWPYIASAGRLLAPALPVALGGGEVDGPDGCYRLRDGVVYREAAGYERPLMAISSDVPDSGVAFELMWFGDAERYVVRQGRVEIEDLFSVARVPASSQALEHLLIRAKRVDSSVVDGLDFTAPSTAPTEIEVHRLRELMAEDCWRDPARLFAGKAGVVRTRLEGDRLAVDMEGGQEVVFAIVEVRAGWRAIVCQGTYPFHSLALSANERTIALTVTLRADVDPVTHPLRGRLAFELNADLVALGGSVS